MITLNKKKGSNNMIKLSRKVKIRKQRETLLISIPKAMAQMLEMKKGDRAVVTLDKDKLIVELMKDDE